MRPSHTHTCTIQTHKQFYTTNIVEIILWLKLYNLWRIENLMKTKQTVYARRKQRVSVYVCKTILFGLGWPMCRWLAYTLPIYYNIFHYYRFYCYYYRGNSPIFLHCKAHTIYRSLSVTTILIWFDSLTALIHTFTSHTHTYAT